MQYTGPCLAYQEMYPPVDDTKPVYYINRMKQPTALGFVPLEWTEAQKRKCHEARLEGRLVRAKKFRPGVAALKEIRHFQKGLIFAPQKTAFSETGEGNRARYQAKSPISASQQLKLYRRPQKHTWWGCSKTPTSVPSTPDE